jgi:hypothetical protein
MLADPRGTFEINWAFAIMFWFSAFLNLLRFRYAKHEDKFWLEEGMESMILVGFALPGVILGLYFYPNPWFMVITEIALLSVWFVLWRFYFEDLVHGFWH